MARRAGRLVLALTQLLQLGQQRPTPLVALERLVEQRGVDPAPAQRLPRGLGVLAKRTLANAAWSGTVSDPNDAAAAAYRDRWRMLRLDTGGLDPAEFALRFTLSQPTVDCAIVGTRSVEHLSRLVEAAARGPLPPDLLEHAMRAFAEHGARWRGQI